MSTGAVDTRRPDHYCSAFNDIVRNVDLRLWYLVPASTRRIAVHSRALFLHLS